MNLMPRILHLSLDATLGEIHAVVKTPYINISDLNPRLNFITTTSQFGQDLLCMMCHNPNCTNCKLPNDFYYNLKQFIDSTS